MPDFNALLVDVVNTSFEMGLSIDDGSVRGHRIDERAMAARTALKAEYDRVVADNERLRKLIAEKGWFPEGP